MRAVARRLAAFGRDARGIATIEYTAIAGGLGFALLAMLGGEDGTLRIYLVAITEAVAGAIPEPTP